jgi:1,4-dihydroxy-2-naphthoate octaprenyltransferase
MRLQFLLLVLICVLLGVAFAEYCGVDLVWLDVLTAFIGGFCAQAAVNLLNDWHDARSGLDEQTWRTHFSGGSGALQRYPQQQGAVLMGGLGALVIAVLCGCWFVWRGRWGIVPIGLLGILLIVLYTPLLTRMPLLCLAAPGLAFGPLVVCGTYYAVGGLPSRLLVGGCLIPFFLVNNLLMMNQLPDIEADRSVGRITIPIRYGPKNTIRIVGAFYTVAFLVLVLLVALGGVSPWILTALLLVLPAFSALRSARLVRAGKTSELIPALRNTVVVTLLIPLILAVVLLVSGASMR